MEKKYLDIHKNFYSLFYDFEQPEDFQKNMEKFFDDFFDFEFDNVKKLGNENIYKLFHFMYKWLFLDFFNSLFNQTFDFKDNILQLKKAELNFLEVQTKGEESGLNEFKDLSEYSLNIIESIHKEALTYQILFFMQLISGLSKLEKMTTITSYKQLKEFKTALQENWRQIVKSDLGKFDYKDSWINSIPSIKNDLRKRSGGIKKVSKLQVQKELEKKFSIKKSTFYEKLKESKIDFEAL